MMFKFRKRDASKPQPAGRQPGTTTRSATAGRRSPARHPDLHSFPPGSRLGNRYRIERLLGQGAMGVVYEARDEELSIPVALKALRLDVGSEREALWRLKREVLLARSVAHPHVCRVYDLGRHVEGAGAVWFLTMELLHGETLRERLRRRGRLAPEEALPLAEQMAAGLGAAHRSGVVHRDFKSGNVMLVGGEGVERAVVMDFGLARAARAVGTAGAPIGAAGAVGTAGALIGAPIGAAIGGEIERTEAGVLVGTPAYMAPEQVRGEEAGPAADIYALGVVLYQMVTGALPFTGRTGLEAAVKRLIEDAPSPRSVVAELDERWEAAILRCLAREPESRFRRAEEVPEALSGREPVVELGALARVPRLRSMLPAERDAFVGREAELEELGRRLAGASRLVTLLGAGGMGKTRLAVRYGWQSLDTWPGGVWHCDLTEARSSDGIASAVAGSLGVRLGESDPVLQLGHAIAGHGRCLVILDNFEQAVGCAADTVGRWLGRAPEARFVVTSRERLNLRGEQVQAVEPLGLESGVELFVERARRHRPGYGAEGSEAVSLREVVQLVEGIPLAIELAAARVRLMTAAQLVERMRERFRILAGGEEGGRHATLRAAIDGSWELLRPWEQAAWAQSAVFEGGFTLEAAEGVLDLSSWPEAPWVLDVLQSLVDKSLLRMWVPPEPADGDALAARFGMYLSLQDYAREKLSEEGAIRGAGSGAEAQGAAEERHGRWYARYGKEDAPASDGQEDQEGTGRQRALQPEIENLVAACRRAAARGDGGTAVAAYRAAWEVFDLRGPFGAAVELGLEVLAAAPAVEDRAPALMLLGRAEWSCGRMEEARTHSEAALAIHRELGDRRGEGIDLGNLAGLWTEQGRMDEARELYESALAIHRQVINRRYEGIVLGNLGALHLQKGDMEEALARFEAALAIHRETRNRRSEGIVLGNLGVMHTDQGRLLEARRYYEAALAIHQHLGDRRSEGIVLGHLGIVHVEQGRMEEAAAHYEAALAVHREVGNRRYEGIALGNWGHLNLEAGRLEEASAQLESSLAIHGEVGNRRSGAVVLGHIGTVRLEQGRLAEARAQYEAALAVHREVGNRRYEGIVLGDLANVHLMEGRIEEARQTLTRAEALLRQVNARVELGKLLCIRVELELGTGDLAAARATLGEAEAIAGQVGAGPDSDLGRKLARLRHTLARYS